MPWWIFEISVFIFLILSGAFLVHLAVEWKTHLKKMNLFWSGLFLMVCWSVIFYGSFIAPQRMVVTRQNVSISPRTMDSLKIAVLSDLHIGRYKGTSWVQRIVDETNELQPDVILIAGDFIFDFSTNVSQLNGLVDLQAPEGVFAVTGNHDYDGEREMDVVNKLEEIGITVLRNEQVVLRPAMGDLPRLVLAGASDIWYDGNVADSLIGTSPVDQVILLAHNPDVALEKSAVLADLIVAGHTHGGQVRLPWFGPIGIIPTKLGQDYDRGLFSTERSGAAFGVPGLNQQLFITSGLGETGTRARLFNPPEVALLFLER